TNAPLSTTPLNHVPVKPRIAFLLRGKWATTRGPCPFLM
ncbi:MAG: hypothetical protein ACI9K2_004258, partial [Myxococcota bacterium]